MTLASRMDELKTDAESSGSAALLLHGRGESGACGVVALEGSSSNKSRTLLPAA
jgi:hypothetical protein